MIRSASVCASLVALVVAVIGACLLKSQEQVKPNLVWHLDIVAAQEAARSEDKDLFVVFTGRGWCQPCEILDSRVLQTQEFQGAIADGFVCVEYDINFGESAAEGKRESLCRQRQEELLADTLPTLVLADSEARPYCYLIGPSVSDGAQPIIDTIASAKLAHCECKRHFARSSYLVGADRALALHEGLKSIAPYLSAHSTGDDPLLVFYASEIQAINECLPNSSPVRSFYAARGKRNEAALGLGNFEVKLRGLKKQQRYADAMALINLTLESSIADDFRWRLETDKVWLHSRLSQHKEVVSESSRLLAKSALKEFQRLLLIQLKLRSLTSVGDEGGALLHINEHIKMAPPVSKFKLKLLFEKAKWFDHAGRRIEASAAWRECRQGTRPNTFDRLSASAYLARSLQKEGEHLEAIELFEEILSALELSRRGEIRIDWPWTYKSRGFTLISLSESEVALGNWKAALGYSLEAEASAEELSASGSNGDRESAKRLRERIREVRRSIPVP